MRLFRAFGNFIRFAFYALRLGLFHMSQTCGSYLGAVILVGLAIAVSEMAVPALSHYPQGLPFLAWAFWMIARLGYLFLRNPPQPPRYARARKRPPRLPVVTGIDGTADAPSEAVIVGRLNPKLRDLLRQG